MPRSEPIVYVSIVILIGAIVLMNFSNLDSGITGMAISEGNPLTLELFGSNGRIVARTSTSADIEIYNYETLVKLCLSANSCSAPFIPGNYIAVATKNRQIIFDRLD